MPLPLALALFSHASAPHIQIDRSEVVRRFDPRTAFGAGIDGHERGEVAKMLTPGNAVLMKSMGLRSLTLRLRTELGCEAWHWNPEGTWSEPALRQGYWTSSPKSQKSIWLSYGYRLPRRGDSIDQANRDDYSRLDDGDPSTFWKSNPYLDPLYTGVSYQRSPQWIVLDFKKALDFNELRYDWANPYPTKYRVEYTDDVELEGPWNRAVPTRDVKPHPGENRVAYVPFHARFIKVLLLASSGTSASGATDKRDRLGFAANEIGAGFTGSDGVFHDFVVHAKRNSMQTLAYVSSTDPWHRASDIDPRIEQPGFDFIINRGFGRGESMLVPTSCLYGTPQDAANEITWLRRRGVKLRGVELGEEPDGNWVDADQYAQLYMQMAQAVRRVDRNVPIGGPSFQTPSEDYQEWPHFGTQWLTLFKQALRRRHRLSDFGFCSFEWYPFDDVSADVSGELVNAPHRLAAVIARLRGLGMERMPWYVTEFGWSSFAAPPEVEPPGAVFDFEVALASLGLGCKTSYQYGFEPNELIQEVTGAWGNIMAILQDEDGLVRLPTYWSAWLLTHRLCAERGPHVLLKVTGGNPWLGAYAVRKPGGAVELALLNRTSISRGVSVESAAKLLHGVTYGRAQFSWTQLEAETQPELALPPAKVTINPSGFKLPPYSITILDMGNKSH